MKDTPWDHGLRVSAEDGGLVGHAGAVLLRKLVREVKGTAACQRTGSRAQASGAVCRGTRAIWQRLDCLKPSLQKV